MRRENVPCHPELRIVELDGLSAHSAMFELFAESVSGQARRDRLDCALTLQSEGNRIQFELPHLGRGEALARSIGAVVAHLNELALGLQHPPLKCSLHI